VIFSQNGTHDVSRIVQKTILSVVSEHSLNSNPCRLFSERKIQHKSADEM